MVHAGVTKGVKLDVAVGVMEEHVKPGSKLGPVERHVALAREVPVEEANVASVVKSAAAVEPPHLAAIIAEETHKLLAEFGGDVLSGKLPKEPPVRAIWDGTHCSQTRGGTKEAEMLPDGWRESRGCEADHERV